tara:strand:+ start:1875 stop:2369 length:495 start_codon:yes stop_codon:yes gene_type:complete
MTELEKLMYHLNTADKICDGLNLGDVWSFARFKEVVAAYYLGHTLSKTLSGPDAFLPDGRPVEYKSTTGDKVKGAYTGVSVQRTWEEQDKYLEEEKIGKYAEHYYNRFEGIKLIESWVVPGNVVYELLRPKFEVKYPSVLEKKDPRLSATMSTRDIKKYGKRVI